MSYSTISATCKFSKSDLVKKCSYQCSKNGEYDDTHCKDPATGQPLINEHTLRRDGNLCLSEKSPYWGDKFDEKILDFLLTRGASLGSFNVIEVYYDRVVKRIHTKKDYTKFFKLYEHGEWKNPRNELIQEYMDAMYKKVQIQLIEQLKEEMGVSDFFMALSQFLNEE